MAETFGTIDGNKIDRLAETLTLTIFSPPLTWIPVTKACTPFAARPAVFWATYDWAFTQVVEFGSNDPLSWNVRWFGLSSSLPSFLPERRIVAHPESVTRQSREQTRHGCKEDGHRPTGIILRMLQVLLSSASTETDGYSKIPFAPRLSSSTTFLLYAENFMSDCIHPNNNFSDPQKNLSYNAIGQWV